MPNIRIVRRDGSIHNVMLDRSDYASAMQHAWTVQLGKGFKPHVFGRVDGRVVRLHRWLLGLTGQPGRVSFVDGNGLNLHRSNLRIHPARGIVPSKMVRFRTYGITFEMDQSVEEAARSVAARFSASRPLDRHSGVVAYRRDLISEMERVGASSVLGKGSEPSC